jgi:drug/metabolite transporter (DMT)-like permease
MKTRTLRSDALLLTAATIWGFAFVAQRVGMEHVGPFTFNAVRFALGGAVLLPLLAAKSVRSDLPSGDEPLALTRGMQVLGSASAGLLIFLGASLQQSGIVSTTAGKAGFITGLYVVIVPIMGLFFSQRSGLSIWAGAVLAVLGLYFLSVTGRFTIVRGDLLVLASAFFWAGHVQLIAWLTSRMDPLRIAFVQFMVCSALSAFAALLFETVSRAGLEAAAVPILYVGFLSTGVGYTLQVVAQREANPGHAAIILSTEAVFAAIGGMFFLGEKLSPRGLAGCALMLAGMIVSPLGAAQKVSGEGVRTRNSRI